MWSILNFQNFFIRIDIPKKLDKQTSLAKGTIVQVTHLAKWRICLLTYLAKWRFRPSDAWSGPSGEVTHW